MTCLECGGSYKDKSGHLELSDKYIGTFEVENVDYLKCDQCNDYLFPTSTTKKIREKKKETLDRLIKNQPIEAFMSVAEAADYLGKSRQALHKHRRIRRGFIFQTKMGGKTWYLRKSVQLFKKRGDGRYPLVKHQALSEYITLEETQSLIYTVEQMKPRTSLQAVEQIRPPNLKQDFYYKDVDDARIIYAN